MFQNYSKLCPPGPSPPTDVIRYICTLFTKDNMSLKVVVPPPLSLVVELYCMEQIQLTR